MKFRIGTIAVLMVVAVIAVKTCYTPHLGKIWEHVPAAVRAAAADQDEPIETLLLPDGCEIEPGVMFQRKECPMTSQRMIASNQGNAQKSTGLRSASGKGTCARMHSSTG